VQLNVDEQAAAEDEDARDRETRMQAELQRINRKRDIRPANPNAARQYVACSVTDISVKRSKYPHWMALKK
jgi:hypothetical protein